MATSGVILVTGATGNIGSGLVPALAGVGQAVRVVVRHESKAEPLKELGVEVVVGDLKSPETAEEAVAGVSKIYLLTANDETAADQASNVIVAASRVDSPHIVRHGAFGPESRIIATHAQTEAELKASGLPYTFINPTFFMQNTMMAAQSVASDGVIYMPFKDGKLGMIDLRDIVDVAFAVLTSDGHEGKSYTLTGPESISFHGVAAGLSAAVGKDVTYVSVPLEAAREALLATGMSEWTAEGHLELMDGFSEGWADLTTPDVSQVTGHPARSYAEFARDFAGAFRGS